MKVKHWETRKEKNWEKFSFNQPYEKGLRRLREDVLGKTNFDPAVLWQWGTMQASAVIEILKTVEKKFGREGQDAVREALYRVGYDIGKQITDGTKIPGDMPFMEWVSFYVTIINRIAYASLETPEIASTERVNFHIDWCPHQDHYNAMDCRVQRYFVQGMIDAAHDYARGQGRADQWDAAFLETIPAGSGTCYFELFRGNAGESKKWADYTRQIEDKAIKIARGEK